MLVTLLERQLVCLRILKMQVWLERYLFKRKVVFSAPMKCFRIRALVYILYAFGWLFFKQVLPSNHIQQICHTIGGENGQLGKISPPWYPLAFSDFAAKTKLLVVFFAGLAGLSLAHLEPGLKNLQGLTEMQIFFLHIFRRFDKKSRDLTTLYT